MALCLAPIACTRNARTTTPPAPAVPGVEVTTLIIDDQLTPPAAPEPTKSNPRPKQPKPTLTLSQALAPSLARPSPLPDKVRQLWARNGLRAVTMPRTEFEAFAASLRIAGPIQHQFISQSNRWASVHRGTEARGVYPVQLDDGIVDISSGAFRLLLRCYLTPSSSDSYEAAMHLDFVPQHADPRRMARAEPDPFNPTPPPATLSDEGIVFEHLLFETVVSPNDALVIFSDSDAPASPDPTLGSRPFGPDFPSNPTLGDALLSDALIGGRGRVRCILAFMPTTPEHFSILP
jgi:hypothetical protein